MGFFSVSKFLLLLPSVKFRVNPWQMLLLVLLSVANLLLLGLLLRLLMFNRCGRLE